MNNILYSTLVVVALVIVQVSGEENEWLTLTKNGQNSIKNSITKINSYGANENKVKLAVDNAYNDFVNYVKNGVAPILKKLKEKPTEGSTRIQTKLNNWIKELENINSVSDSYKNTLKNSMKKFEDSIDEMVKDAPEFYQKIKAVSPENRESLLTVATFMKEVIKHLAININEVESQFKNAGNGASSKKIKH